MQVINRQVINSWWYGFYFRILYFFSNQNENSFIEDMLTTRLDYAPCIISPIDF